MNQPKEPRGNFVAFVNQDKQGGDRRPIFIGRIAKPDSQDEARMRLWVHEYVDRKTGEVRTMYNGYSTPANLAVDPNDQIEAFKTRATAGTMLTQGNLQLRPRQILLFPNGFKLDEPLPANPRPDDYGYWNPADGTPLVRVSSWTGKDPSGQVMLAGKTSYPLPNTDEKAQQDADAAKDEDEFPFDPDGAAKTPKTKARAGAGRG